MLATKSQELDQILQDYPHVKQSDPIENTEFIRFTVELEIDPDDHPDPPQLFLSFTQSEFAEARRHGTLESQLRAKIERNSFTDSANGREIQTSLGKERDGDWVAVTVDGSIWTFDTKQDRWIKGPISL